ncbi:DUF6262 family protein [Streptomyces sp. MZ04]|uniref:DUF6262 family protein n=1 Tax=Streptomyces sp. MZ04 TaxID=2559236 RepID=UPI001ADF4F84|nr:DUF6262 family protein [Streptomyces sp. MZ04]
MTSHIHQGTVTSVPGQTAAAVAARKRQTQQKLTDVDVAIGQLRRERGRLTVRAIAARAAVSATFLYENPEARARVQAAIADSKSRHDRTTSAEHDGIEATWRERALNAEAELTRAQKEIYVQRHRIGELMGQVRDFSQTAPGESVEALVTENTNLKHRVQQLTREHRRLQERLEGARANLRFADKRAADLEMQVLELQPGDPGRHGPQTGTRPPSHP